MHAHGHAHLALREIDELYISVAARTVALSLVSVFVPVYLFTNHGLAATILFFILSSAVQIAAIIPVAFLISARGAKHSIILSIPLTIAFYVLLSSGNIWLSAAAGGIGNALFWTGYHADIAMNMRRSRDVGSVMAASMAASSASPFIGAVVISAFGYGTAFYIASALLVASAIPLMLTPDRHRPFIFSLSMNVPKHAVPFMAHGLETSLVQILWPIVVYRLFRSNGILGLITSISLLASMAFILKVPPTKHTRRYRKYVALNSVSWIGKAVASGILAVASLDMFQWIVRNAMWYDFNRKVYGRAKREGILNTIVEREIATQAGKIVSLAAVLMLKSVKLSMILSAAGTLLYMLI